MGLTQLNERSRAQALSSTCGLFFWGMVLNQLLFLFFLR